MPASQLDSAILFVSYLSHTSACCLKITWLLSLKPRQSEVYFVDDVVGFEGVSCFLPRLELNRSDLKDGLVVF